MSGSPPRNTIVGDIDDRIRFPGAIELVRPGTGSISCMQLLSNIPVPGTVTADPNP